MANAIPDTTGVAINGVLYRYTVDKDPADAMLVHIQNKDTQGPGYVFRETDDWSGLPSSTIKKFVAVPLVPADRFGDGSIDIDGNGQVLDASVVYTYRIDPSARIPSLPDIPEVEVYNALEDNAVVGSIQPSDGDLYEDESSGKAEEEDRLKTATEASEMVIAQSELARLQAMALATNINPYYAVSIQGGVYKESLVLMDAKLPNSKQGLRNGLAQQILHTKMVDMQWER